MVELPASRIYPARAQADAFPNEPGECDIKISDMGSKTDRGGSVIEIVKKMEQARWIFA